MRDDFRDVCDGDRFPGSTIIQTLIDRAHEQDGNFHDYRREVYETAMHSPRQRFKEALPRKYIRGNGSHSHTLGFAPARPYCTAQHSLVIGRAGASPPSRSYSCDY